MPALSIELTRAEAETHRAQWRATACDAILVRLRDRYGDAISPAVGLQIMMALVQITKDVPPYPHREANDARD